MFEFQLCSREDRDPRSGFSFLVRGQWTMTVDLKWIVSIRACPKYSCLGVCTGSRSCHPSRPLSLFLSRSLSKKKNKDIKCRRIVFPSVQPSAFLVQAAVAQSFSFVSASWRVSANIFRRNRSLTSPDVLRASPIWDTLPASS